MPAYFDANFLAEERDYACAHELVMEQIPGMNLNELCHSPGVANQLTPEDIKHIAIEMAICVIADICLGIEDRFFCNTSLGSVLGINKGSIMLEIRDGKLARDAIGHIKVWFVDNDVTWGTFSSAQQCAPTERLPYYRVHGLAQEILRTVESLFSERSNSSATNYSHDQAFQGEIETVLRRQIESACNRGIDKNQMSKSLLELSTFDELAAMFVMEANASKLEPWATNIKESFCAGIDTIKRWIQLDTVSIVNRLVKYVVPPTSENALPLPPERCTFILNCLEHAIDSLPATEGEQSNMKTHIGVARADLEERINAAKPVMEKQTTAFPRTGGQCNSLFGDDTTQEERLKEF